MRVPVLTGALILTLCGCAVASIPYTDDGISCVSDAILQERSKLTGATLADCKLACKRVQDTILAQKSKGCEVTAGQVHELMRAVDNPALLTSARAAEILEALLHEPEKNCFHDLEHHLLNREKFCSDPGATSDMGAPKDSPMLTQTRASALRRFAYKYLHTYLVKKKQKNHDHQYCFPAMLKILNDPAASAFTTGKCKPIFNEKWKSKSDCTPQCWQSIKDAAARAGGAKCCLAKYYELMLDFTYGTGKPFSGASWTFDPSVAFGSDCSTSSVPCTGVQEAVGYCKEAHGAGDADAELYLPQYCASASSLPTSMFLSAVSAVIVVATALMRS